MRQFFNPQEYAEVYIPMYGTLHMITLVILILLVVLILTNKERVKKLSSNERFMKWIVWGFIAQEIIWNIILWAYKYEPVSGRFPLHLCAMLSIILPIMLLTKKYNSFKFYGYWAICTGFIAFANPSFQNIDPFSFHFLQYCVRHYFLFTMPIFLQVGMGFKHSYGEFWRSIGVLSILAFLIFILDWTTGANYMYLGKNNDLAIPFLPTSFTAWPWIFPSFIAVGILLLHIGYLFLSRLGRKNHELQAIRH